jgi:mRNA-degrading endonuclease RelE of RelBE toxin-antitoxin system
MKVEYSKDFEKSVRKLSGKMLLSVRTAIQEVIDARSIDEITDCKKLVDYDYVYRIRIGDYRAFFIFHVQIVDDTVMFGYLVSRGEAYARKTGKNLRQKDK